MNRRLFTILFLLFWGATFFPGAVYGQELTFQGQLDSVLIVGKVGQEPAIDSVSELQGQFDWGTMDYQLSLDASLFLGTANLNPLSGDTGGLGLQLNKLYFQSWFEKGEFKAGKQRIAWGSGYFYNPTDVINPVDPASFEFERKSTPCLYGNYFLDRGTLEAVLVADFQPVGPATDSQADAYAQILNPDWTGIVEMPAGWQEEWEAAIRYSTMIGDFDTAFLYYHGREDFPVNAVNLTTGQVAFSYPQKDTLGLSFSGTIQPGTEESIGVWGEMTYSWLPSAEHYSQFIMGADYTFDNGLHLLAEYYYDGSYRIFFGNAGEDFCYHFLCVEADQYITDLLQLSVEAISPLDLKGQVLSLQGNYSLSDNLEINAGLVKLISPQETVFDPAFGFSPFTDRIYAGIKYYF